MLTGFPGPHLSQRQLCPADTFVLSAVLLVFGTLTGAPDQIGAPPAFTGFTGPHLSQRQLCPADTCTLSSPTVLWYSYRRSGPDRCSASIYRCLRQNWQMLTGFTGPHLSQKQYCVQRTLVLSAVLLVFGTLTGAPDQVGAPPAFTGASDRTGRC